MSHACVCVCVCGRERKEDLIHLPRCANKQNAQVRFVESFEAVRGAPSSTDPSDSAEPPNEEAEAGVPAAQDLWLVFKVRRPAPMMRERVPSQVERCFHVHLRSPCRPQLLLVLPS